MPGVKNLIRYQQNIAAESGIAFWNMFEAMGGEGSMVRLVHAKPSLANYDYTHINFRGGRHLAGLLYETLIYGKEQYERRKYMRLNRWLGVLILLLSGVWSVRAQDLLPACPQVDKGTRACKPMREPGSLGDTVSVKIVFPVAFKGVGRNEVVDSLGILAPVLEHLRLVQNGSSEDTVRIVHIGDSHIRGHIFPRTTGARLTETFGAISYTDMGVNGATCLTFTHPDRIAAIAALKPELLILSFGTNESHNRKYNSNVHYRQMEELLELLRDSLPDVPILMTTPPGSYESFRQRRRRRTYAINPRTVTAVNTIHDFARRHKLVVWDMYNVVGGSLRACKNWSDARLMRPDHVHYLPEGYTLQGELLYEAIIKAYNEYVSH